MAKEVYYLRHKIDQELYVYLEIGDTWEDSYMMEFRLFEPSPHFIKTGALYEHRHILIAFKLIAITDAVEAHGDKKLEWVPIKPDEQLEFVVNTFKETFVKPTVIEKRK